MEDINYLLVVMAAFLAVASPGPATLAIANRSMNQGRIYGVMLALGVFTGSLFWSICGAFGLGTLMYSNVWLLETVKYLGACYLLYLAYKSFVSACQVKSASMSNDIKLGLFATYSRGLLIHLTNPKPILFFGSLYSIVIPAGSNSDSLAKVIGVVAMVNASIFVGYALMFSNIRIRHLYTKTRRVFESLFALFFGAAGFKILTSKLDV